MPSFLAWVVRSGARLKFGPAGWDYQDWKSRAYPELPTGGRLAYLARFVDAVEINTTFYRPARREMCRGWARKVAGNPAFLFTVKLWRGFTHEDGSLTRSAVDEFRAGLGPLQEADRLGGLLAQFPWSFRFGTVALRRLDSLLRAFSGEPLVVEFRHESWNRKAVLDRLGEADVGFCNIDQPLFSGSLGPTEHRTGPVGYIRLHGRNRETWFRAGAGRDARYDYLYSRDELQPWAERVRRLAERAETVFVITNNHFRANALVNLFELRHLVEGRRLTLPPPLLASAPRLAAIGDADTGGPPVQLDLFGS